MNVSIRPTTDITYAIPATGGIYLHVADETGGDVQVCFHPKHYDDALDRLDALIETAIELRDAYRRKVEAEAHAMAAEDEDARLRYERELEDEAFARHNAA